MNDRSNRHQVVVAWLTVASIAAAILLTLVASLLTPHTNMVESTISDVAAGPYDWVQDLGLYVLAAALFALAYGMSHMTPLAWHWKGAILTMPIMAIAVAVMAYYHEYGDGDSNRNSIVIHIYLVYAYGIAFLSLLLLSIPKLTMRNRWWKPLNVALFVAWLAVAIYYCNMSTAWDGLVERFLGLAYLGWLFLLAWRLAIEGGSETGKQAAA